MDGSAEEPFEKPYVIVDVLPRQVPEGSPGRYFAVESCFLKEPRILAVKRRHADLLLKLYCYRDLTLDDETDAPDPERVAEAVEGRYVRIMTGGSMIVSAPDELFLTVYAPDAELLGLLGELCAGEGLYLWAPPGRGTEK